MSLPVTTENISASAAQAARFASLAAFLTVAGGVIVLIGWVFDIPMLKSILPNGFAMKANAAIGFILTGAALWLIARRSTISILSLPRFFLILAGLIGVLTLAEYAFDLNLGIDQLLFHEPAGAIGTSHPGRMAQEAALNYVLLSVALWLAGGSHKTKYTIILPVSLGLLVAILGLVALMSYFTPGLGAYGWFGFSIMAIHASILFLIMGIAVIAISWRSEILPWSLGRNTSMAFLCGMIVLVFIGFSTSRGNFKVKQVNHQIAYNEEVLSKTASLLIDVVKAQSHVRSYIVTGNEQFRDSFQEAQTISRVKLDALRKTFTAGSHRQQEFADISASVHAGLDWFQKVVDARQAKTANAVLNGMVGHGEKLLNDIYVASYQTENEHRQLIDKLKQESDDVFHLLYLATFTGTFLSLLIFLMVMFRLNFAVSDRNLAEKLRISALKYQLLFESSRDALMTLSPASRKFISANQATLQLFRTSSKDEFTALDLLNVSPEQQPDGHFSSEMLPEMIEIAMREGSHFFEWKFQRLDGQPFFADVLLTRMNVGESVLLQATIRDITERKQIENEVKELNQELESRVIKRTMQLEAANKDMESFSYSISHDLRAPLRAINGFSKILKEEYASKLDDEGKRLLNVVGGNAQKMGELIDDILAFSRAGRDEVVHSMIDMKNLTTSVWEELEPDMGNRIVQLDIRDIPPANGDPAMMHQVVFNLLSNAVKFTQHCVDARVEVGCNVGECEAVYYVRDNGAGFDMQYAPKLFGVFQRLHSMDEFVGTGIGLAIVKRIIDKHGGRVWAEGKPNEGATFYFALPVGRAPALI